MKQVTDKLIGPAAGYQVLVLLLTLTLSSLALAGDPVIKETKYESGGRELVVKVVKTGRRAQVTFSSEDTGTVLAQQRANKEGKLEARFGIPGGEPVPCTVRATTSGGSAIRAVEDTPSDCGTLSDSGSGEEDEHTGGGSGGDGIPEHEGLTYDPNVNWTRTCLECHSEEASHIQGSTHYEWKGLALYMSNWSEVELQGKHAGAVNTYCGNILGNWEGCSACHIGLGAEPGDEPAGTDPLENIDCLICHQEGYKRKRVGDMMVPDVDNMSMSMEQAMRTVHKPNRATCLQCHAKAGGGDAVKRGDLALATAHTTDVNYDVHMATTGANLSCQDCHVPEDHRFPGKGSDIRPTDLDVTIDCASSGCHSSNPHESSDVNRHTDRLACQTCHIPTYAKDASDSAADEATETHRSWLAGSHHDTAPKHPVLMKANDLTPVYRHWNRISANYLLFDEIEENPATRTYQTSVPLGAVDDADSKLYPFKYKTSDYPWHETSKSLVALDTKLFFAVAEADDPSAANAAALSGLTNMGVPNPTFNDFKWVITDTYQLLNHQVSPKDHALRCTQCHMSTARMDLQGELGYAPTNPNRATCASGCHESSKSWEWSYGSFEEYREHHKKHKEKGAGCNKCHGFTR